MDKAHSCDNRTMVTYDFRVRATLGDTVKIESPLVELTLASGEVNVAIKSLHDEALTDAREFKIIGNGYVSAEEAMADGVHWRAAVAVGFARVGLAADFRERALRGYMGAEFLDQLRAAHPEVQMYNDDPGVL